MESASREGIVKIKSPKNVCLSSMVLEKGEFPAYFCTCEISKMLDGFGSYMYFRLSTMEALGNTQSERIDVFILWWLLVTESPIFWFIATRTFLTGDN